ncbi:MAG: hypothetical protein J7J93_03365 [Candidatus Aenigmarchaeota archaeon]|nr:hypothetical protein [Candidatus Aenigmarchaeota archaeon]
MKFRKIDIIILIIFFISVYFLFSNKKIKTSQEIEDVSPETTILEQENCIKYEELPEHPTLQDCENVCDPIKKNFCINDVAEINNNITLCKTIPDNEIKIFCIARISLNETMCYDLIDKGLIGSCLESINLKKEWLGI